MTLYPTTETLSWQAFLMIREICNSNGIEELTTSQLRKFFQNLTGKYDPRTFKNFLTCLENNKWIIPIEEDDPKDEIRLIVFGNLNRRYKLNQQAQYLTPEQKMQKLLKQND